jgi:protein O-mannosyl-transferase
MAKRRSSAEKSRVLLGHIEDARFHRFAICGLVILTLAIFANTLPNQFVNWDDHALIVHNPATKSLSPSALAEMFTPTPGKTYQPVRVLSYAIDHAVWGLNPVGYHLMNTALHTLASVLLFLTLGRALPQLCPNAPARSHRIVAISAALLFAWHPVNVEAVTWMSSRKYGLLAVFAFAAFFTFAHGRRWLALAATLLAMLSSPFGITIPPLLMLYDFCRGERLRALLITNWPLIALEALMVPLLFLLLTDHGGGGIMIDYPELSLSERLLTMMGCLAEYSRNLVCPLWLNARYPHIAASSLAEFPVLIGIAILIAAGLFVWRRWQTGDRLIPFCAGWAFITWLPVSNLVPISTFMADRYLYLPAVGIFIAIAFAAEHLLRCGLRKGQSAARLLTLAAIVPLILACITIRRNADWRNSLTLWQSSVDCEMSGVSLTMLGSAHEETPDLQAAHDAYCRAVEIAPKYPGANNNLGSVLFTAGKLEEALPYFRLAVDLQPNYPDALYNLGSTLSDLGKPDEGEPFLRRALELEPRKATAHNNLGLILKNRGDEDSAIEHFRIAAEIDPTLAPARYNLAHALFRRNAYAEAVPHFSYALATRPEHSAGQFLLGVCHQRLGNDAAAIAQFRIVLELRPGSIEALTSIAWLLATRADSDHQEALRLAISATQLTQGKDFAALDALAAAQAATGDFAAAVGTAEKALALAPADLRVEIQARRDGYQAKQPYLRN